MAFNASAFLKTSFEPRTADVPVPALADFFGDDRAVFTVRGLTANEIAKAKEAAQKNRSIDAILSVVESATKSEQITQLRDQLGLGKASEDEVVQRIEHLVAGSVQPTLSTDVAVKLAKNYPIEFFALTNKITELTGQGFVAVKKPQPSGENRG